MSNILLLLCTSTFKIVLQELCVEEQWRMEHHFFLSLVYAPKLQALSSVVTPFYREWTELQLYTRWVCLRFVQLPNSFLYFLVYLWLQLFQGPRIQKPGERLKPHNFSLPNSHPPLMLSQQDSERGRWMYWGFLCMCFCATLLKYCLSATNPPFFALLCGTGSYKLRFSLPGAGCQGRQQRALETLQIRRDFSLFSCLAFLVGGKWLWLQGSSQRCGRGGRFSGRAADSPTCVHAVPTEVWLSLLTASFSFSFRESCHSL